MGGATTAAPILKYTPRPPLRVGVSALRSLTKSAGNNITSSNPGSHQQSAPRPVLHKVAVEDGIGAEAQLLVEAEAHLLHHVVDVENAARGLPQLLVSTYARE